MIPLMSLYYPPNIIEFCKILVPLHGEPTFLPNIFEEVVFSSGLKFKPYSYNYELMGYKTSFFIINAGRKILLTSGVMVLMPLVMLVAYKLKKTKKSFG